MLVEEDDDFCASFEMSRLVATAALNYLKEVTPFDGPPLSDQALERFRQAVHEAYWGRFRSGGHGDPDPLPTRPALKLVQ